MATGGFWGWLFGRKGVYDYQIIKNDIGVDDLNDLDEAIRLYKRINVIDPQHEEGYYNLGLLYMDMKDFNEAWNSFDLAIKNSPTFLNAYYYRAVASEQKGDKEAAISDYKQILNFDPDFEAAKEALGKLQM